MENSEKPLSVKELAELSDISYTSLITILKGERDFGVSKLIELSDALQISPNAILKTLYQNDADQPPKIRKNQPKYYACFLTTNKLTRCRLHNELGEKIQDTFFPFSLYATSTPDEFVMCIKNAIEQSLQKKANFKDIYIYATVLGYEHVYGRKNLIEYGSREFGKFIIEEDWRAIHNAVFKNKAGMVITINDGSVISCSNNQDNLIHKYQGYGHPISDDAGSFWLGSEAIRHAINTKEGLEEETLLSDKILSSAHSDLNLLATKAYDSPRQTYGEISSLVQELSHKNSKAMQIIEQGFQNIWKRVSMIDNKYKKELPIYLYGDLAHLYEPFFSCKRLVQHKESDLSLACDYCLDLLRYSA